MKRQFLFAIILLTGICFARELKYISTIESGVEGDRFGIIVVPAGDVNDDGYQDMLVCAEGSYSAVDYPGKVYLFLGGSSFKSEAALVLTGENAGDHFGVSATRLGDVNDDGFDDFAIAADRNDEVGMDAGKAYIFFGGKKPDGDADITILGNRSNDWFGNSIAGGEDVNGDGKPDFLIGAPYGGRKFGGTVSLFLGGENWDKPALVLIGKNAGDSFGAKIAVLGDITKDAVADFAISAIYATADDIEDAGVVYLYAGGNVVSQKSAVEFKGKVPKEQLGYSVCSPGDVTGDGVRDILIGAPGGGPGGMGVAYVFAGGDVIRNEGTRYIGHHQNDLFGIAVSGAGDFNGDGVGDIMVGAPYHDAGHYHTGSVEIYPGGEKVSTQRIYHTSGTVEEDQCGYGVVYIPGYLGKNNGIYAITYAGSGSGNTGKSKVLLYR